MYIIYICGELKIKKMININFAHIIGFGLIWFCINYKRTEKIESFTSDWFLTFIVLVVAVFLFEYKFN